MANPGIPTSKSHDKLLSGGGIIDEADLVFVQMEDLCRTVRTEAAGGPVDDDRIGFLWRRMTRWEDRLAQFSRQPNFFDAYARAFGLSYVFDSTDDTNVAAAQEKIINLPDNHRFKADHRVRLKVIDGSVPGGLAPKTDYWVVGPLLNAVSLAAAEGGAGGKIGISNAVGTAEMILRFRPDYSSLRTAVAAVLTEIQTNLPQRVRTYDPPNVDFAYSDYSSVLTATLQSLLANVEALIDVVPA